MFMQMRTNYYGLFLEEGKAVYLELRLPSHSFELIAILLFDRNRSEKCFLRGIVEKGFYRWV